MKAKFLCPLVLFLGLNSAFTIGTQEAYAQPDAPPKQVAQQTHSITAFKIEHVRAEIMAWWLNSLLTPAVKQDADKKGIQQKDEVLSTIPGLESVAANPKTNEIWATGTSESITKLRETISFLDRPARTVEVEVQFVEVDRTDAGDLGVAGVEDATKKVFMLNSEFQNRIKTLIHSRRARVLHTSQVTAFNNSEAKVSSPVNGVAPDLEWSITPTIQNDNTITLFFTPRIGSKPSQMFYTTVGNVKADNIMVLNLKKSDDERRDMLAIVSTRIVEE